MLCDTPPPSGVVSAHIKMAGGDEGGSLAPPSRKLRRRLITVSELHCRVWTHGASYTESGVG